MSLKNVHVVFIIIAVLLALFCAVLAFDSFRTSGSPLTGLSALASLAGAGLLVGYEAAFLRRCRREGIQ